MPVHSINLVRIFQISSLGFEFNLMDADSESSESLNSDKEQIISTSPQVGYLLVNRIYVISSFVDD